MSVEVKFPEATHMPDTTMKRRSASSVSIGRVVLDMSRKEFISMLEGVIAGDGVNDGRLGVGGDVVDGIA